MAILRRWSINLLNQEKSFKRSTRQKLKRASMDEAYMLKVLGATIPLQSSLSETKFSCTYPGVRPELLL